LAVLRYSSHIKVITTSPKPNHILLNNSLLSKMPYHITEPRPSVPSGHYIHSGRGGAGNISHVDPKTVPSATSTTTAHPISRNAPHTATVVSNPTASATASNVVPSSTPYYPAGRGGAGNMYHARERPMFSFDEELERQRKMMEHQAPVYHVGRGGAGNYANEDAYLQRSSPRSESDAASRSSSGRGSFEGTWNKLRGTFAK
jgi:hypothetical protein